MRFRLATTSMRCFERGWCRRGRSQRSICMRKIGVCADGSRAFWPAARMRRRVPSWAVWAAQPLARWSPATPPGLRVGGLIGGVGGYLIGKSAGRARLLPVSRPERPHLRRSLLIWTDHRTSRNLQEFRLVPAERSWVAGSFAQQRLIRKRDLDIDSQPVVVKVADDRAAEFARDVHVDQLGAEAGF